MDFFERVSKTIKRAEDLKQQAAFGTEKFFDEMKKDLSDAAVSISKEMEQVRKDLHEAMIPVRDSVEKVASSFLDEVRSAAETAAMSGSKVKTTRSFQTTDGTVFGTQQEAETHQANIDALEAKRAEFNKKVAFEDGFYNMFPDLMDNCNTESIIYFIYENQEKLKEFLSK